MIKTFSPDWKGKRVKLTKMIDPNPVEPGTEGTIIGVDGHVGIAYVKWDNGRSLSLVCDIDEFELMS
jgi:hypothetical protein